MFTGATPTPGAVAQVQRLGRQALDEMQLLLGVLRDEEDGAELDPTPSPSRLDHLVNHLEEAGTSVRVHVDGDLDRLSSAVDLAAYRIVQEAMTNAVKHAPRAPVTVQLNLCAGHLEIQVDNPAPLSSAPPSLSGAGRGLVGVAERVKVHGGQLDAQPVPGGGFRVRARLPLSEAGR